MESTVTYPCPEVSIEMIRKMGNSCRYPKVEMCWFLWRGVVCDAAAGEADAPTWHLQPCLGSLMSVLGPE